MLKVGQEATGTARPAAGSRMSELTALLLTDAAGPRCSYRSYPMVGCLRQPHAAQTRRGLQLQIICRQTTRRITDGVSDMHEWVSMHVGELMRVALNTTEMYGTKVAGRRAT